MDNKIDLSALLFSHLLVLFVGWLVIAGISGGVAALVAPHGRRSVFFAITLFFLGPVGIGFAAIAQPRPPWLDDAWQYRCEGCGAVQNVAHGAKNADCYRCEAALF